MQVNFLPEIVDTEPALVHAAPAFTAPKAGTETKFPKRKIVTDRARILFMLKIVLRRIGIVSNTL